MYYLSLFTPILVLLLGLGYHDAKYILVELEESANGFTGGSAVPAGPKCPCPKCPKCECDVCGKREISSDCAIENILFLPKFLKYFRENFISTL